MKSSRFLHIFMYGFLLFTLLWSKGISQSLSYTQPLIFDHFQVTEGLSQSWVTAIQQDEKGFMWIGTRDGLNRYDARNFKIYRSTEEDTTTLNSSHIISLFIDSQKRLWVGTLAGLNLYDRDHDCFRRIPFMNESEIPLPDRIVQHIVEDSTGILWFTAETGIYQLDPAHSVRARQILAKDEINGIKVSRMKALLIDSQQTLWIGVHDGIIKLVVNKSKNLIVQSYVRLPVSPGMEESGRVNDIVEYPTGTLWLATESGGLFKLDLLTSRFEHFPYYADYQGVASNHVRKLMLDREEEKLWIGTRNGLSIYHLHSGTFENYRNEIDNPYSLSDNSIHSIFKDKDGAYWLGTYNGGANICSNSFFKINVYKTGKFHTGLNYSTVSTVSEITPGKLLIGTEGGGLNLYDRSTGKYAYFTHKEKDVSSLPHDNIKCIYKDSEGEFWIGTSGGGICTFDPEEHTFRRYHEFENGSRADWVYSITEDTNGLLWIGTYGNGLNWFDKTTKEYGNIKSGEDKGLVSDYIRKVFLDTKNRLWVGTDNGLSIYEPARKQFRSIVKNEEVEGSLQSNRIFCINEDSRQNIWIGTLEGGLHKYLENSGTFDIYTAEHGLPGNNIYGILEGHDGNLWISTNRGISRFNPESGEFKNYTTKDGLLDLEYNYNAYFKSSKGELFFGGRNGLISFYPETIQENKSIPRVVITDLKLFNKPVAIGDESKILTKQIAATDHITLNHKQNVITLSFSVLNYIKSGKNKFAYRLDGLEKDWNYVEVPSATYTNLQPGTYTFMAKGANNDGYWNQQPTTMKISVLPAPWKTVWAYLLYLLVILGAIYTLVRYQSIKVSLEHDLKLIDLENKQQKELNQAKLKFFTDVSHEIRTPLTLVLTPLENLITAYRSDTPLYRQLIGIKNNADHLLRLVNQLLDFRKKESEKIKLNVAVGNIVKFLQEIKLAFQEHARQRNITYTLHVEAPVLNVYYDRDELEKVFFNLLSNAFKYTPDGGRIEISIATEMYNFDGTAPQETVKISVIDNGVGISEEDIHKIFERFYKADHHGMNHLGTGIGLSLSKAIVDAHHGKITCTSLPQEDAGKYTAFSVYLRKESEHFAPDEIIPNFRDSEHIESYQDLLELPDETEMAVSSAEEYPTSSPTYTLLIVEDNEKIRIFLAAHLSKTYKIYVASNGIEALELACEIIPDIVIADVIMPKMDGVELCSQLKKDERTSHIPVIILTARTSLIHKVEGIETGADEYITKPFHLKLLHAKIRNLIRSRELMRKKFSREITLQPENIVISSTDEKFLMKVKNVIEENIANPDFSVEYLIREVGMSRPVLYRKIKALTNMSVFEFINSYRLNRAAHLLKQSDFNIAETATQVGFSDPKYFSKAFRKKFGMPPSEYH